MIKVALYLRVSTEEQALHGYSIEAQREALVRYAKEHDMVIVDIFVDEGISARKRYNKRKAFLNLLQGVQEKRFELILFTKLDRWFRNVADYHEIQKILEKNDVHWKSIYENYDTTTSNGRLHVNIMLSVAQDEADRTGERIKAVFENKRRNKQVVTGMQPFGYNIVNKMLEIDEEKAEIVKDIFNYYLENRSKYGTTKYMNAKYGFSKSYDFYSHILETKMYTGEHRGILDYCPAIIPKKTFDEVQKLKKQSFVRQNQTLRVYIFSGIIKCKDCGRTMCGRINKTTQNDFFAYACKSAKHERRCHHTASIREDKLEAFLLDNLNRLHDEYIAEMKEKKEKMKKTPISDKKVLERRLKKLKELYLNELISMDEYRIDYESIKAELAKFREEDVIEINTDIAGELIGKDFIEVYNKLEKENKRIFWRSVLKEIIVDADNNVSIIF